MNLHLTRKWFTDHSTIGELMLDGKWECLVLEPAAKGEHPRIPTGRYRVVLTPSGRAKAGTLWSPRPDHALPLLLDVPGREAIRVHAGNSSKDTEGCLLVGERRFADTLDGSRIALIALMAELDMGLADGGEVYITIVDADEGVLA